MSTRSSASLSLAIVDSDLPAGTFSNLLAEQNLPLRRTELTTLQINMGKRCNQACIHCHVEAGPKRTEMISAPTVARIVKLLKNSPDITTVDITGGAPELNDNFRFLVQASRQLGRSVIDRCNLTVLFEPGQQDLAEFLAANQVLITASMPCYSAENVESQRGQGVFDKSIKGLQLLNSLGYGVEGSGLELDLVYNPVGAYLPPAQAELEADYKVELAKLFGITFNKLFTITNMPISRFVHYLRREGKYSEYMNTLVEHFNPHTVEGLMCRSLVSVCWQGNLYDCDFNQMLELGVPINDENKLGPNRLSIFDIDSFSEWSGRTIATANHCFGCTAGAGSSCGGALE